MSAGRTSTFQRIAAALIGAVLTSGMAVAPAGAEPVRTIAVELELWTGGTLAGPVVVDDADAVVVVSARTPYVVAWDELSAESAYQTRRSLLAFHRGGADQLTAADHFELGELALRRGLAVPAQAEFRAARALDEAYYVRVDDALARHRARREGRLDSPQATVPVLPGGSSGDQPAGGDDEADLPPQERLAQALSAVDALGTVNGESASPKLRAALRDVYERFGVQVIEQLGPRVRRTETPHFLLWTDLPSPARDELAVLCERMYQALCLQFGVAADADIFVAKCPIFCFADRGRFLRFAREFDGYGGGDALGYSRSIPTHGHVHIVLYRPGGDPLAADRFAWTLVHEGTHAFVHRLGRSGLIPNWVNEGLAEMMAERVLGPRCPAGEKAALLAGPYVEYGWPIAGWLGSPQAITAQQYPLAQSVVTYLDERSRPELAAFIRALQDGSSLAEALAASYAGLTLAGLEADWRTSVRQRLAATAARAGASPLAERDPGR